MYKLAEWYSRVGNLEQSALVFRSADRILRESEGEISVARADALMGLAKLYERQGNRPAAATTLRKGIKLLDSNPEPDLLRRAQLQVALGDLYTRDGRPASAKVEYAEAWRDLSGSEEFLDERDEYFRLPLRLSGGPYPNNARNPRRKPGPTREGFVVIRYDVDADGRAANIKVVESEPPGLMDDPLKSVYRRSAYRPRFVDGDPMTTTDLLSRHDFSYVAVTDPNPDAGDKGALQQPEADRGRLERPGD
jgi:tetratricopeptide (TPR) repeat protein